MGRFPFVVQISGTASATCDLPNPGDAVCLGITLRHTLREGGLGQGLDGGIERLDQTLKGRTLGGGFLLLRADLLRRSLLRRPLLIIRLELEVDFLRDLLDPTYGLILDLFVLGEGDLVLALHLTPRGGGLDAEEFLAGGEVGIRSFESGLPQ